MEDLLVEMRNHRVTKEEFEIRRMVIWKMEELKKEKWRLEDERKAAAEQQHEGNSEERDRQLAQLRAQLEAGLIDKAEYEEKCKNIE